MKRENAKMTDEEYEAFQKEEADFWNSYLEERHKQAMPDLTVTYNGYTVKQVYAHETNQYEKWWYDAENKLIMHYVSNYQTEDELRSECEKMDYFVLTNRSRID